MTAAQRLATAASIDLAVARSHAVNRSAAQAPTQRTITIGSAGTRGLRTYVQLFVVIAAANDVRCDVATNSTFVYAYGFAEDIDASHALYASLVVQMVRASDSYIASGHIGPRRRSRPGSTSSWRSGPASDSGWPRRAKRPGAKQPRTVAVRLVPLSPCGTRMLSCAITTAARRRHAAPGRPPGPRQGIHRRPDEQATGPADGRAWATALSCPGRASALER